MGHCVRSRIQVIVQQLRSDEYAGSSVVVVNGTYHEQISRQSRLYRYLFCSAADVNRAALRLVYSRSKSERAWLYSEFDIQEGQAEA